MTSNTVLIVENDPKVREGLVTVFKAHWDGDILEADTLQEAKTSQAFSPADLLLVNHRLPDGVGTSLLHTLTDVPCVILLNEANCKIAIDSMKQGAVDVVITSDMNIDLLPSRCLEQLKIWSEEKIQKQQQSETISDLGRILDQSVNEIYLTSTDTFKFIYANQAARDNLGYSLEELYKLSPADIKEPGVTSESLLKFLAPLHERGVTESSFEAVHYRKDGSTYLAELHVQISSFQGKPCYLGIVLDNTKRKQIEEKNASLENQLHRSQKLETIGRLAGGIAHDFNNILTPIIGYAEMAMEECETDSLRDDLTHIVKGAQRARQLVSQILVFSGQEDNTYESVSLISLITEIKGLVKGLFPSTIRINTQIETDCGDILGDSSQIHQVLLNFCTNAANAMSETGGELTIRLRSETKCNKLKEQFPDLLGDEFACIEICDTGPGIPKEIQGKIFEPFFTTNSVGGGTGLGLSVAHGIISRHGGVITLSSSPEEGTSFYIYLPIFSETQANEPVSSGRIQAGTEHLLIVDDEEDILAVWKRTLGANGYRLSLYSDACAALEAFRKDPESFDLLITDQTMPNMRGDELAAQIRSIRADLPIILLTGFSESLQAKDTEDLPIDEFLLKPVSPQRLTQAIRKIICEPSEASST